MDKRYTNVMFVFVNLPMENRWYLEFIELKEERITSVILRQRFLYNVIHRQRSIVTAKYLKFIGYFRLISVYY